MIVKELLMKFGVDVDSGKIAAVSQWMDGMKTKAQAAVGSWDKLGTTMATVGAKAASIGKDLMWVSGPMLAIGAMAKMASGDLKKATNAIIIGTGASGEALAGLRKDFDAVFMQVPQGAEETGKAMAGLFSRTSLTGTALQSLTVQLLDLGRMTGEDMPGLINTTTRVFGDWGVATKDQAGTLDYLFKVGQLTGIGINDLSEKVVHFGAPLRQMGFDFQTSAALMGSFKRAGVETELVMGSLRIALGKMSKDGIEDPAKALKVLVKQIKDVGSTGKANAIALDTFGARAGPDMAASIREGRWDIDKLLESLKRSPGAIQAASDATKSFSDRMAEAWKPITLAMEPIGRIIGQQMAKKIPALQDFAENVKKISDAFQKLNPITQDFIFYFGAIAALAAPAALLFGKLATTLGPVLTALKGITLAGTGFAAGMVLTVLAVLVVLDDLYTFLDGGDSKWAAFWGPFAIWARMIGDGIKEIPGFFKASWDLAKSTTSNFLTDLVNWFTRLPGQIAGAVSGMASVLVSTFAGAFMNAYEAAMVWVNRIKTAIANIPGVRLIANMAGAALDRGTGTNPGRDVSTRAAANGGGGGDGGGFGSYSVRTGDINLTVAHGTDGRGMGQAVAKGIEESPLWGRMASFANTGER